MVKVAAMEGEKRSIRRPMKLIENVKARGPAYKRRKANVMKKTGELATLCGITVCTVCLGPDDGEVETFPNDPRLVKAIIETYRECEVSGGGKRRKKTQAAVQEANNKDLKKKRDLSGWSDNCNWVSNLSTQASKIVLRLSESKLRDVDARIDQLAKKIDIAQNNEKVTGNCKANFVNQPPQILGATATAGGGYSINYPSNCYVGLGSGGDGGSSFSMPWVICEEGLGEQNNEQHISNSMNKNYMNYDGDCQSDHHQQFFFPIDHDHQQQFFFPIVNSMNMTYNNGDCPIEEQQMWGLPIDHDYQQQFFLPMAMTGAAADHQLMNSYHHHQLSVSPLEEHEQEHELVYVQPLQSVRPPPPFRFGSYGYYQGDSSHIIHRHTRGGGF